MFNRILIANRGEIALRIIRAAKELGIKTVAVYSEADRNSLHTQFADEAVCIGKANPQESYLNISAIISAAEITDSDAIHPGYGFLAENYHFAEICESCGIKFIGPKIENIKTMGNKTEARRFMAKHHIPIIPGSKGNVASKEEALNTANKIGYPLIIKAAAGGGGRGMRICHSDVRLLSSFTTARSEAEAAFGDGNVYIEKYIEAPKHIEAQIAADNYGNVVFLGERECSIQRRHQKLIEESPSPAVNKKLRRKIAEYALRGAKSIGYSNVGTIEFLLDTKTQKIYFIEMNTRIQVEHTVTEEVTGIDLVKLQIMLAAGEKMPSKTEMTENKKHAIECRINAEDPERNFIPSAGKIEALYTPGGFGVRVDTHIYSGYSIPPFYDSLLAKLIITTKSRSESIETLKRALSEFVVEPIKTTIPLYQRIVEDPVFIRGEYTTHFLDRFLEERSE